MAVNDTNPSRIQYVANGVQTVFTVPFEFPTDASLAVYVDAVLKTLTTDYTCTDAGEDAGGSITFVSAPANAAIVTIERAITFERPADYQQAGSFYSADINADLDQLWFAAQQIQTNLDRAIQLAAFAAQSGANLVIGANATARADKLIGFDGSGDVTLYSDVLAVPTALAGQGLSIPRVNAGETGYELRTPAETLGDIGGQPLDATLTALAALNSTAGLVIQTAADTFTKRTLTGTSAEITVSNGDGVSGNPTLSLPSTLTLTGKTVQVAGLDRAADSHLAFNTGSTPVEQLRITHTASAVNYLTATGAATAGNPTVGVAGSDTNIGLTLSSKGTGAIRFLTSGGTASFVEVSGESSPALNFTGSNANVNGVIVAKGTGEIRFSTHGSSTNIAAKIIARSSSTVNFWEIMGDATGGPTWLTSSGSDTNIGMVLRPKGTGPIYAGTSELEGRARPAFRNTPFGYSAAYRALLIGSTSTSSGTNFDGAVTIALGVDPSTVAGGNFSGDGREILHRRVTSWGTPNSAGTDWQASHLFDATQWHRFFTDGGEQFRIGHTANAVNYINVGGNATGGTPYVAVAGADTNIGFAHLTKGNGAHAFATNSSVGNLQLRVSHTANAVNYVDVTGASTGNRPYIWFTGSDTNVGGDFFTRGTGGFNFFTHSSTSHQAFNITAVANAVNYLSIRGAATGNRVQMNFTGSDTNVGALLVTKGNGTFRFDTGNGGSIQLYINHTASPVSRLQLTGAATGQPIPISIDSSDTNVDIDIQTKGTGVLKLNGTTVFDADERVPASRLGTGTADSTVFLRGDSTWATPAGGGNVTSDEVSVLDGEIVVFDGTSGTAVHGTGYTIDTLIPAGIIAPYAGSTAPTGWLLCAGQAVSRSTYASLFAIVSTVYGVGDGSTTFNLPDLRGRVVAGKDDMNSSDAARLTTAGSNVDGDTLGASGGAQNVTLTAAESGLPAHSHTLPISPYNDSAGNPPGVIASTGNGGSAWSTDASIGASASSAHNNVQPTLVLNYIIKY